jgi:cytochrome oxidase Cu insertion factor (SCO1/SenC/PrrC family)
MNNKFRCLILITFILSTITDSFSQTGKVPPFQIILYNGTPFKAQDLPLGKHIIIVYFSPECEDCHKFTAEMLHRIGDLQSASIAMITYMPVEKVKPYVTENKLDKYPNIYVGTEGSSLFVRSYYRITHFPFVALYDMNGNLVKEYTASEINLDDLINRLKKL